MRRFSRVARVLLALLVIFLVIAFIVSIIAILVGSNILWPEWTGFGTFPANSQPGPENYQRSKTLWDWLELLIIPTALATIAIWFNRTENQNSEFIEEQRAQEEILQSYLNEMSNFLLDKNLRNSSPHSEIRVVVRAKTITTLNRLNGQRKGTIIKFLHEARLIEIQNDDIVINLKDADLSGIDLSHTYLGNVYFPHMNMKNANLQGSLLVEAHFDGVDLQGSDLRKAIFRNAILGACNLRGCNISGAVFKEADLGYSDLRETSVTMEQLKTTKSYESAELPKHIKK